MSSLHNQTAVGAARQFLSAYQRGDRATMRRLMTHRLLARNRHEYVSDMLGVDQPPPRITIVRVRRFHARWGRWARVVVRLDTDHGAVTDQLGIIPTPGGYRVNTIKYLSAS